MLKIIVLLIIDLIIAILLVCFAPLPADEGEGKTAYRGVVGDGGVVDCDALLPSAASCSVSFSSKTRYSFTPFINEDRMSLNGCTASKLYIIFRHGTRYPGKNHIRRFDSISEKLSNLSRSSGVVNKLRGWINPFLIEEHSHLSSIGRKELYCLAKRFKQRYSGLFDEVYSPDSFSFASTHKKRCVKSALSFAEGLFDGLDLSNGGESIGLQIDDRSLRFFDNCKEYTNKSKRNESLEAVLNEFLFSDAISKALREIQQQIDESKRFWIINEHELLDMYQICAMETANFGHSNWCSLFSYSSLQALEYYYDMKSYWTKGHGHTINWSISCHLINDIINSLSPSNPAKVTLRFAHAETLVPLLSALSLYKDDLHLLPSNYHVMSSERKFRVSKMAPFSGNLAFVVYRCTKENDHEDFVHVLSNEAPVTLDHSLCTGEGNGGNGGWCPLQSLPEIVRHVSDKLITYPCSLKDICIQA
ncbi:PREDICTED: multiple inositol polyphosphate phosphatase 1-like isoform X2 [Amphimedon queenslandica]|uniref:Multiple inositol polyphosphate phosphatase 1 n=1 Tax=Amphimedon queenslandica TaxID=400682 RepID=A0A1X7UPD6_AMPQE|nr:PREDICTED: multiple inositol polyphosphate phosphatase 1-like isoform X2 [Amphimedon queenslandica]|eukprot:XP_019853182.1 PREDICTED: multiple inositol polyphosphate phosphatase 1-like isoform X2 [Amphimedon queenslandica]